VLYRSFVIAQKKKKQFHRKNIAILGQNTQNTQIFIANHRFLSKLKSPSKLQTKNHRGDQTENEWKKINFSFGRICWKKHEKKYIYTWTINPSKTSRKLIIIIVRILEICF
jgi:hypothetical protein